MKIEKSSIKSWIAVMDSVKHDAKNVGLSRSIRRIAALPKRRRIKINLNELCSRTKTSESVIVPGKVLSAGVLDKKFDISAIEYSDAALKKLKDAGCRIVPVEEMIKKEGVRLLI
jgi:large subunit ribosomal protein L18e